MELKTARLTLLIDPDKKVAFERLCAQQDRTASQVVRQLIRDYLAHHGVQYATSGAESDVAAPTGAISRPAPKASGQSQAGHGTRAKRGLQPGVPADARRRKG